MRVKQLLVLPSLPEKLRPLQEMAHNLWYSWNWEVVKLFIRLDPDVWEKTSQNPVEMLSLLPQHTLQKASEDEAFVASLKKVYDDYQNYLKRRKWFQYKYADLESSRIAYFSLEYGLDTGLPVYSGGLGVLSGDTLKSASDLGMPMVAVGLLYRYGYFRQFLSSDGWQQERYEENDWYQMPVSQVKDEHDQPLKISLVLDNTPIQIQVWKVMVGVIPLYLLDTNIAENSSKAREITSVLYGGDKDMRIRQEIVLGIGGVKALRAVGIDPTIFHINEGHSWFLTLERIRVLMSEHQLSFQEASQCVWSTSIFTTHTPVPAGNEKFDQVMVHRYLGDIVKELGITWQEFMAIGRVNTEDEAEAFGMTVAALKFSAFANSVSELHGRVSRNMWHNIWPGLPPEEVPIRSITNGVHPSSWISHDMNELYESYFGPRHSDRPGAPEVWEKVFRIPDVELWRVHNRRRERLVFFARKKIRQHLRSRGATQMEIHSSDQLLDPHIFTIGFARRFSTYKRGLLLFRDLDRLEKIINNPDRPVQIILSGKAHPLDNPGKEIIQEIVKYASEERFQNRIIFLEDYDINVARYLVQGADIWLNNPRRPQEASGTSGMKAALNGALNLSILDGWWCEGFSEDVGFKIGNGEEYDSVTLQDQLESEALYNTLEREIIPLFYRRNEIDLPVEWIKKMKASIHMAGQRFSAQRMLMDYANNFYVPAIKGAAKLSANGFELNRQVTSWLTNIYNSWDKVNIVEIFTPDFEESVHVGQVIPVQMKVQLGDISPDDVTVEIVAGRLDSRERFTDFSPATAQLNGSGPAQDGVHSYVGEVTCHESGRFGVAARVVPKNEHLLHTCKPKLISWW